jgi:transposase
MAEEIKFRIKVYSKSELARIYGIGPKTFARWLDEVRKRFPEDFPEDKSSHKHLLNPKQVKRFVEHHGPPSE